MVKGVRWFRERLREDLKDREFRRAFDREERCASLAIARAKAREKKKTAGRGT